MGSGKPDSPEFWVLSFCEPKNLELKTLNSILL